VVVSTWMTENVITINRNAPISNAHRVMKQNDIRRLPVIENGKLVGIITIGDVREASPSDATTLSIWELNYLWAQLTVERVMTTDLLTVTPTTPVLDAAELMLEHKVSGLPVVGSDSTLVGILTESDIFRMLVRSRQTVR
ncbi:MAG: CBS domain-containing protein, partial [Chloroflexota bacterium]